MIVIMLQPAFGGCRKEDPGGQNGTAGETVSASETVEVVREKTNADIIRQKYRDTDYGGTEIRFLSISPGEFPYSVAGNPLENELYFEAESGDVLYDAIYKRNMLLEEMLGISVTPVWGGNFMNVSAVLKNSVYAGDRDFGIVLNRLDYQLNDAAEGMLYNLYETEIIEPADPWWNARLTENFLIAGNRLYAIAGDLNFYDDYAVNLMMYNKRIADDHNLKGLYDTVRDGKWVLDRLIEMCRATTLDLNGDGRMDETNDLWGMAESPHGILHFIYACGETMSHTDEQGEIVLTYNERLVNIVGKLTGFLAESGNVHIGETYGSMFTDGRKMFYYTGISALPMLRGMEDDFGLIPVPKWDESQRDYLAYVSNGSTTAFSVPVTNDRPDRELTVLDAMSALSMGIVREAIYENLMKNKYVRDEDSLEMLDAYIFKAGVYDWAGDLAWASGLREKVYMALLGGSPDTFVSLFEKNAGAVSASLENFTGSFK